MKTLSCLLLAIVIGIIKTTDAKCERSSGGVYTFGPNCDYMCHCKDGEACNSVTGDCQNGCVKKWFGPGCQYRDIAEGELSRHIDNVAELWSFMANDGNLSTCSETDVATASRTISPWWRLWLPHNETITSLEILTRDKQLQYFNGFNVTVEYVPEDKSGDQNYYPPDPQLCYKYRNFTPTDKKIHVTCDKPLIGNQIRIQLASTKTQLVLCDVRVSGGRNIAFNKQVTSSSVYNNHNPPSIVVDGGVRNESKNHCFLTSPERVDWININLDHISHITFVRLTYTEYSFINNYQLYVSNTSAVSKAVTVHDDRGNNIPTTNIALEVIGQYLGIKRQSIYNTEICEIEVYGDCVSGKCGYDCSQQCHCKTLEDRISGNCVSGCDGRWTKKEAQCLKKCGDNEWGSDCAKHCGVCKDSALCDVETGYCLNGCAEGYFDSPLCNTECPNNNYGKNCSFRCSGNCMNGRPCRKSDGYCLEGCKPGYTSDKCDEKCPSGTYGHNCKWKCSTHCEGGFSSCDQVNGACIQGCKAGWKRQMCNEECKPGFWNKNCGQNCGHCFSGTCDTTTGVCATGCAAGYKETKKCTAICDLYTFGIKCAGQCSSNCKDVCDNANGSCNCKRGWKGNNCTQECVAGEWGENCANQCGMCLKGTCDRFSGNCFGGCMPGYTDTPMCNEKCPAGKYGSRCLSNCSASCKVPYECNNEDGKCTGCIAGKQGDFCETECDNGTHGENCTKACGNCKPGTFCDKVTGLCLAGCAEGYKPSFCKKVADQTETSALLQISVGGLAGFIVGAVVLISAGIIITACVCRRKNESAIRNVGRKPVAETTVSFPKVQEPAAETVTVEMKESTYEVIRVSREEEHEYEISQDRTLT